MASTPPQAQASIFPTAQLIPVQDQPQYSFNELPEEIILKIFGDLKVSEAMNAKRVCKRWEILLNDDLLWKHFLRRDFNHCNDPLKTEDSRKAYKFRHVLHSNIVNRFYASRILKGGHKKQVSSFVFADELLISGSYDKTIKIWDTRTGHCIRTLDGIPAPVTSLLYADRKLVSGDRNGTVKIWDINTGDCLHTLEGPPRKIGSLFYANGMIIIASSGETRIWDIDKNNCSFLRSEETMGSYQTCPFRWKTILGIQSLHQSLGYKDHNLLISL